MENVIREDGTFNFFIPAELEKGADGKKWVSGIASTFDEDLQGERIKQDGLDLSYFLKRGFFNDDHAKETGAKVGIPTEARVNKSGLWVKGFLLETKRAVEIFELAQALSKAGGSRKLGFSVEGKVLQREEKNPRIITKAWIKDIAITASPINPNTFMDVAKSFATAELSEILVTGENEDEALGKGKTGDKVKDELSALDEATKIPVVPQTEVEKKDAEETTKEALSDDKPKQDIEKTLPDVPVAPKAKSISKKSIEVEQLEDGTVILKGLHIKIKPEENGHVEIEEGETDKEALDTIEEDHKKVQEHAGGAIEKKGVKKSEDEVDLWKGFKRTHEVGGEKMHGDKKVPCHVSTYEHPSGHHIIVTGKDGAFAVNHVHKHKDGKHEIVGGHLFYDDPAKGKKAKEDVDSYLQGFGIKHKHADKHSMFGKAIVSSLTNEKCDLCSTDIQKGDAFMVKEGKTICDETCLEKALVSGYTFGVTDQVGGSALRVESLEGSQRDLGYGQHLDVKVKKVDFDSKRANGGKTYVTLRDAVDFLMSRGIPEDAADRILLLLVKNNGDISKLAGTANSVGGKK